ncbi:mfs general substrate transporter [Trichoderma arundinaceum]|uniref:Mfs general substrate transporter n=1 Tax=Trichoderma arundinaceum TaxID=490622 RepID=A0A395NQK9_TRIAR|nr:mfs general substrate transporter [Trichoderma arundinaceum]
MGAIEGQPSAVSHAKTSPAIRNGVHSNGVNNTKEAAYADVRDDGEIDADNDASAGQFAKKKPLNFYLAFFAINIVVFIFSLDSTSLSVAIPSIADQLHGTTLQSFWAGIAFLLATVITQPLYTSLSDIYGRKPLLQIAFLLFAVGSVVFGLAPNMPAVISGRLLQGLGGGGLDVLGEIIVADMTMLKERPVYLGIMAIPTAVGSILGPSLGAILCQDASWRWIGWINLPCLGVAYPLVLFCLKLRPINSPLIQRTKELDWIGMAIFTSACTLFVLPLSWAGTLYSWSSWKTLFPFLIGSIGLIVFAWYESKPLIPIIPHRLFYSRTASVTLAGAFFHGMILFALMQYLPFFYQAVKSETLIRSALSLLPTSVASVFAAGSSAVLVGPLRGYRLSIWASWVLVTIGTGLLALLSVSSSKAMGYGIPILWGWGVGALLRVPQLPIQASVAKIDDTGLAIGLLMFFRLLGGLVGLAISSTIFSNVFEASISKIIPHLPVDIQSLGDANAAIGFIPKLRTFDISPDTLLLIQNKYLDAFRAIFYAMTGVCGLGLIISLGTEELTLDKEERGEQQFETD